MPNSNKKIKSTPLPNHQRLMALEYLKHWIGTPYLYGGDDFSGFDCSGKEIEILKAVGVLPHVGDWRARDLYAKFKENEVDEPYAGCLVFWWKEVLGEKIVNHVEMLIDEYFVIGASGGDSQTRTISDAIKHNAFVKMRPLYYRGDNFTIVDPFKE